MSFLIFKAKFASGIICAINLIIGLIQVADDMKGTALMHKSLILFELYDFTDCLLFIFNLFCLGSDLLCLLC